MERRHPGGFTIKLIFFNIKERTRSAIPTAPLLYTDHGKDNPFLLTASFSTYKSQQKEITAQHTIIKYNRQEMHAACCGAAQVTQDDGPPRV